MHLVIITVTKGVIVIESCELQNGDFIHIAIKKWSHSHNYLEIVVLKARMESNRSMHPLKYYNRMLIAINYQSNVHKT